MRICLRFSSICFFILFIQFCHAKNKELPVKTFATTKTQSEVLEAIAEVVPILSHGQCKSATLTWENVVSTETPQDIEPDVAWKETWNFMACKQQYSIIVHFHPDSKENITTFNLGMILGN